MIVLGLLLAVALPNFFGASNAAKDSAAKQYLSVSFKELRAAIAQNDGQPPTQASLLSAMQSGEPQLGYVSSAASNASVEQNLKLVYVAQTATGYQLGIHSASGALITLTADRTSGYAPVFSGGTGSAVFVAVPVSSVNPTVSSTGSLASPLVGDMLTAANGTWSGSPTSYSYAWQRCDSGGNACVPIAAATASSYTLASDDSASTVRGSVTAANAGGSGAAASSSASGVVQTPSIPASSVVPSISGTVAVGQVLTATSGTWTGVPAPTYSYQWQRCGGANYTSAVSGDSPSGWWRLDDSSTGFMLNSGISGNGNYAGSVALQQAGALGGNDKAVSFTGGYGNVGSSTNLNATGAVTIEAWIYPRSTSGFTAVLAGRGGSTGQQYSLYVESGALQLNYMNASGGWSYPDGGSVPVNQWSYVGASRSADGNTISYYVNGVKVATAAGAGLANTANNSQNFYIGYDPGYGIPANTVFNGLIDELAVYRATLTDAQITAHYTAATGCLNLSGATSQTYTTLAGDSGAQLRVAVSATNSAGTGGPAYAARTSFLP